MTYMMRSACATLARPIDVHQGNYGNDSKVLRAGLHAAAPYRQTQIPSAPRERTIQSPHNEQTSITAATNSLPKL
jgi:hypothetical protein